MVLLPSHTQTRVLHTAESTQTAHEWARCPRSRIVPVKRTITCLRRRSETTTKTISQRTRRRLLVKEDIILTTRDTLTRYYTSYVSTAVPLRSLWRPSLSLRRPTVTRALPEALELLVGQVVLLARHVELGLLARLDSACQGFVVEHSRL